MIRRDPVPQPWNEFQEEIERLLRTADPTFKSRTYLTPIFYVDGIAEAPENYPHLSQRPRAFQMRYISYYLKEKGRVPRGGSKLRAQVWMLPEAT